MGKMHYRAGLNQIPLSEYELSACLLSAACFLHYLEY